ncbi:hypothetical protein TNCV_1170951 [Trichonephila clavipes]|nr:hypothetical protein TNCV_1170951 [Trichonephila clavipes]
MEKTDLASRVLTLAEHNGMALPSWATLLGFGGQSFLLSNYGHVDDEEMIPPDLGVSHHFHKKRMSGKPLAGNKGHKDRHARQVL